MKLQATLKDQVLPLLKDTVSGFQEDEAGQLGAALAYYAMFSLFPLLLLLVAGLGFVLRYWDEAIDVQQQILDAVGHNFSPQLSTTLAGILGNVKSQAGGATIIGLVTLLLGASGVFQQLDLSFNKIWDVPKPAKSGGVLQSVLNTLRTRLVSFGMVLAVGFLLLVSMALTGVSQALLGGFRDLPLIGGAAGVALSLAISLLLNTLVFALLFKFLPDTTVYWRDVWLGALVTALVWELAKYLLAWYIGRSAQSYGAYGAVGTVLVIMVWVYFSSQILFLGAEFTEAYARRHGSRAPAPAAQPGEPPAEAPAAPVASRPSGTNVKTVAVASGAGLALGLLGALVAAIVGVALGARKLIGGVAGLVRRKA
ncbi:YihY/virulence factor BrkB family protein [Kouleothrix sp.]|uniref:YihY/virulence factor BrkB family protein n=1 Tax=Kouleothrix sp. TaxID=2779161 RepID=UPI00391BBA46